MPNTYAINYTGNIVICDRYTLSGTVYSIAREGYGKDAEENLEFQKKVYAAYEQILNGGEIRTDGTQSPEKIMERINHHTQYKD